jgi:translation initiation factor 2B subunit (eIF-2B alpha/beta/delta family)
VSRQLERAIRRSQARDRKRRPKMVVTGKTVFRLSQLINRKAGARRPTPNH